MGNFLSTFLRQVYEDFLIFNFDLSLDLKWNRLANFFRPDVVILANISECSIFSPQKVLHYFRFLFFRECLESLSFQRNKDLMILKRFLKFPVTQSYPSLISWQWFNTGLNSQSNPTDFQQPNTQPNTFDLVARLWRDISSPKYKGTLTNSYLLPTLSMNTEHSNKINFKDFECFSLNFIKEVAISWPDADTQPFRFQTFKMV